MTALWEQPDFRRAAGDAWRPGGVALTRRALAWCRGEGLLPPGALALDFGCGVGASLRLLEEAGCRALGLDGNAGRERVAGGGPGEAPLSLVRANLASPPLAAACADMVLCECVLSLLADPLVALRAAHRVLRPGGALIVSDLLLRLGGDPLPDAGASGTSCLAGARPADEWRGLIKRAGFCRIFFEDNSRALVELAARMVWYGDEPPGVGGSCRCGGLSRMTARAYGYGLWIARKESL